MPTTQKTQQTSQFDPGALSTYQGLQGGLGSMLNSYMTNPFGNPFFQTQQQLGTRQAQNLGGTGMSNILRNLAASGLGGGSSSPFQMEMLQNQGRANTGLQANLGFLNPVQNALGMQQFAGGLASQYRPLQTGQQQTQSTQGLGTWLPQVAGMGLSAAFGLPGLFGSGSNAGLPNSTNNLLSSQSNLTSGVPSYNSWSSLSGANPMFGGGGGAPPPAPGGPGGAGGGMPSWMSGGNAP